MISKIPNITARRVILNFPSIKKLEIKIEELLRYGQKPIFIFPLPTCPWGYLFQRPQQIARALSRLGFSVIYCVDIQSACEPDWSIRGIREIEPNLFLFNDGCESKILRDLNLPMVIWQYWPIQNKFVKNMSSDTIYIYDCIDELSTFEQYDSIKLDHESSLERADLILASSNAIYEGISPLFHNSLLVPNAVCFEDFQYPAGISWLELEQLRQKSEVIIGYYGAIAEWMDFELLEYCANMFPNWTFLLVGQVYPETTSKVRGLSRLNNIKLWPRQDYSRIPHLLSNFDVAIVPFKINDITRCTSPVKIFEYMAGGKPIVSTDLPECRKYSSVLIGSSHIEFAKQLKYSLNLRSNKSYLQLLIHQAKTNTWDTRVSSVIDKLKSNNLIP